MVEVRCGLRPQRNLSLGNLSAIRRLTAHQGHDANFAWMEPHPVGSRTGFRSHQGANGSQEFQADS
jgi:hypothetical protein